MSYEFQPALGLKNTHFQTLYSSIFRKDLHLSVEVERFTLSDGDFVECHWHKKPKQDTKKPIVILFHGLNGSYKSPYIQGVMQEAKDKGLSSVVMHFRGCSGKENDLARAYHSGDSDDARSWINHLHKKYKDAKLFAVGYSLGGNMLLKLLGEDGKASVLSAAVSVSAPLQLDVSADKMLEGFSRFYQYLLIKDLNTALAKKFDKHDMKQHIVLEKSQLKNIKTFWEFDGAYTAPMHNFKSAQDYYTQCSAKQFLKNIKVSTLIIHAKDDPFMTPKVLPNDDELSENVSLEVYPHGGHVGFIAGTIFKPKYWLEKRIVSYLVDFLI